MGRKKASDKIVMNAVKGCKMEMACRWRQRFGPDLTPFDGVRRAAVQEHLNLVYQIQYSDGGMRNRLKSLVNKGKLEKFRIGDRTVYYL